MKYIIDSSVALCFIKREPGWENTLQYIGQAHISTVNYTEVKSKLLEMPEFAGEDFFDTLSVIEYDKIQASKAADLYLSTRKFGLSLGDRACIALGIKTKLPVITMDRAWKNLQIGHQIICLR